MSSNLLAIYTALAAVQVPVNGVIVPVLNVDELPGTVASAETPVRLLMPWSGRGGKSSSSVISLGGTASADWRIVDLLLLRPAQSGKVETGSAGVVRYMQDYATAMNRNRILAGAVILGDLIMDPGVGAFPASSSDQWYGVEVTLTVREMW